MDDAERLHDLRRRLPAARTALLSAIGDMPANGAQDGSQTAGGASDRTGRLALGIIEGADGALNEWRDLDRHELTAIHRLRNGHPITRELAWIVDIVDRWAPTPERRLKLHANLADAADGLGADGCTSCARLRDHQNRPVYSEQHPGLKVCQSCHTDLNRARVHQRHRTAVLVPVAVIQWRQRHPGRNLSEETLTRILGGRDA